MERFRMIDDELALQLGEFFGKENLLASVLFSGNANTSRLTECYYIAKQLCGGDAGGVKYYLNRNIKSYIAFAYSSFLRSGNDFTLNELVRVFDICFNSPAICDSVSTDEYYSFLDFKAEILRKEHRNNAKISKLAKMLFDFFSTSAVSRAINIDDTKDIVNFLSQSLSNSKTRSVIIENLENSNPAVCNALLKTLEEPFDKSLIILISKRPSALLKTILSRVVRFNFYPIRKEKYEQYKKLTGFENDYSYFQTILTFGDEKALDIIKNAAYVFYNFIKEKDFTRRDEVYDILAPVIKKGFSKIMDQKDVANAFFAELSQTARNDFLQDMNYALFYKDLLKRINEASRDVNIYSISIGDAIETLMF